MTRSSGTWIPVYYSASTNIKVRRVAREMHKDLPTILGHLVLLWNWACAHTVDGVLENLTHNEIAECAQWSDGHGDEFVRSLIDNALLDTDPLRIHEWESYGGWVVRKKEENRLRQALHRERNSDVTVTSRRSNALQYTTLQDKTLQDTNNNTERVAPTLLLEECQYEKELGTERLVKIGARAAQMSPQLDERWLRQSLRTIHSIVGDKPADELVLKVRMAFDALARALTLPPGHKNTVVAPKHFARQVLLTTIKGDD